MNTDDQPMLIPQAPKEDTAPTEELERDIVSIRSLIFRVVLGLLVLSLGVNIFMWRQVRIVRVQLADEQRQIDEYNKADPVIRDLMRRLQAFAVSHPDFQPIIAKYNAIGATNTTPRPK